MLLRLAFALTHGSAVSKLNLEIFLLTFFMVTGTKTKFILKNFFFSSSILAESMDACGHITNM